MPDGALIELRGYKTVIIQKSDGQSIMLLGAECYSPYISSLRRCRSREVVLLSSRLSGGMF
jgi:hypothetical protein